MNSDQTFILVMVLAVCSLAIIGKSLNSLIGAITRRITGSLDIARTTGDDRDRELDELRTRLAELEERVDFTERVLLQQPEQGHVPAGGEQA